MEAHAVQSEPRAPSEFERFAFLVAHDLQEPIRVVASRLQMLGKRCAGKVDADAADLLGSALEHALRVERVLDDILAYSRFAAGDDAPAPTDTNTAFRRALAELQPSVEQTGAAVTCDPLPTVTADAAQIEHLFKNLVSNALTFRGAEAPRVHVSAARQDGEWLFSVRDNGIGIAPRYFDRIFTPFQRLHGGHDYPGAGIGLAIARKVAERHGGRIWVESEAGCGATFFFTLPADG